MKIELVDQEAKDLGATAGDRETEQGVKSSGWSKEFPRALGWYWMRGFRQYRTVPVEVNGNKFSMMFGVALYDAADADEAEFLGPITPSDTEELFKLRAEVEALRKLLADTRRDFDEAVKYRDGDYG